jgi:hypothetical protein
VQTIIKKQLLDVTKRFTEEDSFYLYHPNAVDISEGRGRQTAVLGNYESDGYFFDLHFALKQTLYVAAQSDGGTVCLVTDRFRKESVAALKKIIMLNAKDDLGCRILAVSVEGIEASLDSPHLFVATTHDGVGDVVYNFMFSEHYAD